MLTLYEYSTLNNPQRGEILWSKGTFIANLSDANQAYSLYTLFGFYVEVIMIENEISEIIPFKQGIRLEKYLGLIDISELKR